MDGAPTVHSATLLILFPLACILLLSMTIGYFIFLVAVKEINPSKSWCRFDSSDLRIFALFMVPIVIEFICWFLTSSIFVPKNVLLTNQPFCVIIGGLAVFKTLFAQGLSLLFFITRIELAFQHTGDMQIPATVRRNFRILVVSFLFLNAVLLWAVAPAVFQGVSTQPDSQFAVCVLHQAANMGLSVAMIAVFWVCDLFLMYRFISIFRNQLMRFEEEAVKQKQLTPKSSAHTRDAMATRWTLYKHFTLYIASAVGDLMFSPFLFVPSEFVYQFASLLVVTTHFGACLLCLNIGRFKPWYECCCGCLQSLLFRCWFSQIWKGEDETVVVPANTGGFAQLE